jgi:thioredoxin-like negative regulator of GroEL
VEGIAPDVDLLEPKTSPRPRLFYFFSRTSGPCRRTDGYLAHVLQRGHNHQTFDVIRIPIEMHPNLVDSFGVARVPTLVVLENGKESARIEGPRSSAAISRMLGPWLR